MKTQTTNVRIRRNSYKKIKLLAVKNDVTLMAMFDKLVESYK